MGEVTNRRRVVRPRLLTINLRLQHTDERQVTIPAAVVEAISDHELVGDLKSAVVDRDVPQPAWDFVQKGADLQAHGNARLERFQHEVLPQAGISAVVYH